MNPNTDYKPISNQTAAILNLCCLVVNDWAEKKGWNREPTAAQLDSNNIIAKLFVASKVITDGIEDARHGRPLPSRLTDILFIVDAQDLRDDADLTRRLSQLGLMHTELIELADGLLIGNPPDDHCPELTYEEAEIADLFIRAFHYCGEHKIDLGRALQIKHAYNTKRPDRHGDKLA